MLDLYAPAEGKNHPIVIWIHGGGWEKGDKADMGLKPQACVDRGYLLVSVDYRLLPGVTIKQMTADVAKAVRWTCDHAKDYGGDTDKVFLAGYAAGAQLAALICTDGAYLKAEGLKLSVIKGCALVDGNAYDIPLQIASEPAAAAEILTKKFGPPENQHDLSPVAHVAKGKEIPPFLILYVAGQPQMQSQAKRLSHTLRQADISSKVIAVKETTHQEIEADLGFPFKLQTCAFFAFLDEITRPEARTLEAFRTQLNENLTPLKAEATFGSPSAEGGSGVLILYYELADGTYVQLGFRGGSRDIMSKKLAYANHVKKDGTTLEELPLKKSDTE